MLFKKKSFGGPLLRLNLDEYIAHDRMGYCFKLVKTFPGYTESPSDYS